MNNGIHEKYQDFLKSLQRAKYTCERMIPKMEQEVKDGIYFNSSRQLSNAHKYCEKWKELEWSINTAREIIDHITYYYDTDADGIHPAVWALSINNYPNGKSKISYQINDMKETAKKYILQLNGETCE